MSKTIRCRGCGAEFDSRDKLLDHVVEAHGATCQICGAKTNSKEDLIKHNREKHGV